MSLYLNDIYTGLLFFPLIALAATAPFLIWQYRKYGSIPLWKSFLFYGFVLYLICAFYLVILPLPSDTDASVPYAESPQLIPFLFIYNLVSSVDGSLADLSTWQQLFTSAEFYIAVFNIMLFVPFGVMLRYYFKRPWYQVLILGFCLSLFFEITQLTGIFGIYKHPYRLFDVDDLMQNTLGAMIGYWIISPAVKVLPRIEAVNKKAYTRGLRPSFLRRMLAIGIDGFFFSLTTTAVKLPLSLLGGQDIDTLFSIGGFFALPIVEIVAFLLFFVLVPTCTHGQTLGQKLLRLTMAKPDAKPAAWYNYLGRYASLVLIVYIVVVLPNRIININEDMAAQLGGLGQFAWNNQGMIAFMWLAFMFFWVIFLIVRNQHSKRADKPLILLNELVSNTRVFTLRQIEEIHSEENAPKIEDQGS